MAFVSFMLKRNAPGINIDLNHSSHHFDRKNGVSL